MSTNILYHSFGVRHYRYMKTEYREGVRIFYLQKSPDKRRCAECGSRYAIKKGRFAGKIRTLPIGTTRGVHLHRLP